MSDLTKKDILTVIGKVDAELDKELQRRIEHRREQIEREPWMKIAEPVYVPKAWYFEKIGYVPPRRGDLVYRNLISGKYKRKTQRVKELFNRMGL